MRVRGIRWSLLTLVGICALLGTGCDEAEVFEIVLDNIQLTDALANVTQ